MCFGLEKGIIDSPLEGREKSHVSGRLLGSPRLTSSTSVSLAINSIKLGAQSNAVFCLISRF